LSSGEKLLSQTAGHGSAQVTTIAYEFSDKPLLVTGASDGSIKFHSLSLWRDGVLVAGKLGPKIDGEQSSTPDAPGASGYSLQLRTGTKSVEPAEKDGTAVTALALYNRQGKILAVAGDGDGMIRVFQV
jgi:hypothetical protein